jgi:predicted Zn finger-like uncharacterized protein
MLLTCPSCETRYQVDEAAIDRAAGRQVRCANCGYLWHFAPSLEEHAPQSATARPTAGSARPPAGSTTAAAQAMMADAGVLEADPASPFATPLDLGSAAAPAVGRMGPGLRGLLQLGAVLIVAAVIVVPILARNTVVESWPESAKVYNAVGLNTPAPGSGLDLKVTPLRSEGAFVVTGEITNATSRPLSVPPLRVALRDPTQREVEFQIVDPPVETLAPGASAWFKTVFEHPSIAATDVVATFGAE